MEEVENNDTPGTVNRLNVSEQNVLEQTCLYFFLSSILLRHRPHLHIFPLLICHLGALFSHPLFLAHLSPYLFFYFIHLLRLLPSLALLPCRCPLCHITMFSHNYLRVETLLPVAYRILWPEHAGMIRVK